jgi:hypothetical protein
LSEGEPGEGVAGFAVRGGAGAWGFAEDFRGELDTEKLADFAGLFEVRLERVSMRGEGVGEEVE